MADMTTIAAAMTSVKATKELLKAVVGLQIDSATMVKINDALHQVDAITEKLFDARDQLFELQKQNDELHQQIKTHDEFAARKAQYKLCKTIGGANVYESIGTEPPHFICPSCLDSRKEFFPLQDLKNIAGTHQCPRCQYYYPVDRFQDPPDIEVESFF